MSWKLKGQAGKTLDATLRAPAEMLVEQLTVRYASLDDDTLTWQSAAENLAGGGTILPDIGQVVELYWNATRKFRGHVTAVKVGLNRVQVVASGPWWWMKNTPLTSSQKDATGTSSERTSYVFKTQNIGTSLAALVDRAIALGCPLARGTFATMYEVPRITLAEMDAATALAELLRWVPDAVAWFDYSPALPTLYISRRGAMTALDLSAASSNIEELELQPRLELQASRVDLKFVTRDAATGKPKWAAQASGTNAAAKRQIITISGPEITDYLPKDDFESYKAEVVTPYDYVISKRESGNWAGISLGYYYTAYTSKNRWDKVETSYGSVSWQSPSLFSQHGLNVLSNGSIPDWVSKIPGVSLKQGEISGAWIYQHYSRNGSLPAWVKTSGMISQLSGFEDSYEAPYFTLYYKPFKFTASFLSVPEGSATTLYRPWDYDYLVPPAGLAANLQAAQNWVPWEGRITRVADEVTAASNLLGRAINVTDTLPACATMKALVRGLTYEIQRGRTTYELGTPARMDYGGLVSRVRRDPKDNIVYL